MERNKDDIVTRLMALAVRADDGTEYSPDGYCVPDLKDLSQALREAAAEIERLRLGLAIIASDPHPCMHAIQATAQRYLDGGGP